MTPSKTTVMVVAVLLCAASYLFSPGSAQTCEPWSGKPSICTSIVVGEYIWVPYNMTLPLVESYFQSMLNNWQAGYIKEIHAKALLCQPSYFAILCGLFLPPCLLDEDSQPIPLPQQPCLDACIQRETECAEWEAVFLDFFPTPFDSSILPWWLHETVDDWYDLERLRCNRTDPWTVGRPPLFPNGTYIQPIPVEFPSSPFSPIPPTIAREMAVQCRPPRANSQYTDCPEPMHWLEEDQYCTFQCPLPTLSDEEYQAAKVTQGVLGWMSYLSSFFVFLSYLLHPQLRQFPSNMLAMTCLSAHIASFALVLPTMAGHEEVWCGGDHVLYESPGDDVDDIYNRLTLSMKSPLCSFQGAALQFGFMSGTFWWVFVAMNMASTLLAKAHAKRDLLFQSTFHVLAWGLSALFTLVPLAADVIAFESGETSCFVSSEDDLRWQLAFWMVPTAILLILGLLLFSLDLVILTKHTIAHAPQQRTGSSLRKWILHVRILCFVAIFLVVYLIIFAFRIKTGVDNDKIEEEYAQYVMCLIFWSETRECSLSSTVSNFPLFMARAVSYSILGLLLSLALFNGQLWRMWRRILLGCLPGRECIGWSDLASSRSSFTSSLGRKSNKKKKNSKGSGNFELSVVDEETAVN
ncbi:Frizzled-9 [Balamuthia mandrillaris]